MFTNVIHAQYNPKQYWAFNDSKVLLFTDNFDSSKIVWSSQENFIQDTCVVNTGDLDFKKGTIHLQNNCDNGHGITADLNIDYSRNHEIVAVVKVYTDTKNDDVISGNIIWADSSPLPMKEENKATFNSFQFTGKSTNRFHLHHDADRCKRDIEYVYSSGSRQDVFRRYTIRRYNDKYYFFVDGLFIGKANHKPLPGKLIRIGADAGCHIEVDEFSVFYLP